MPIALLYHDVVPRGQEDASGFPGAGAARYKLTPEDFRAHLAGLAAAVASAPCIHVDAAQDADWLLTFDDGGVSALAPIADLLEAQGWRGHFFITTDRLDTPTFLSRQQLRDLHARGHVIGSHSCSHPAWMSACPPEQILHEWRDSRKALEDALGVPIMSASVPGGFYSNTVARLAAQAGVKVLFNSEPTTRAFTIDGCTIVGRYSIVRTTPASIAVALAQGRLGPRLRQSLTWKLKQLAKTVGGSSYLALREWLLKRANRRG